MGSKDKNSKDIFEFMIKEVMEKNAEEIKKRVGEDLKKQVIESLSWSLRSRIEEATKDFIDTEFMVEIKELLKTTKPLIIQEMQEGFIKIGAKLAEAMSTQAMKNLSIDSYKCSDIMKKIFD